MVKDEKLFFKENSFHPNGGKWFLFWKDRKLIFLLQLLVIWSVKIQVKNLILSIWIETFLFDKKD